MHPHQYSWLRRKCKLKFLIQGNSVLNRCPFMPCNADNISHAFLSCKKLFIFCSITAVWNTFKSYWCGVVHDFPRQERRVYYLHLYKAIKFPCKCVANIADGVDQHTTNIPSVQRLSKAMSALTTVGTHYYSHWAIAEWERDIRLIWLLPVSPWLQSHHDCSFGCSCEMGCRLWPNSCTVSTVWQLCYRKQE